MSGRQHRPNGAPPIAEDLPGLSGLTVAVTGANGFVGARTCWLLAANGADVRALVRREGSGPAGESVTEVTTDLDADTLAAAFDGVDVVVHTAAVAGPDHDTAHAVNVDGTRAVLDAAAAAGVDRVVHVSTTSVLSRGDATVVDESTGYVGDDAGPYAVTKRDAEQVVAEHGGDVATVVVRPPAVLGWGPSSTWGERVPTWVGAGELPMELDERDPVGWVAVDDLARALGLAATVERAVGRTYVVASGTTTFGEYLGEVHGWFPDAPSPFTPRDEAPGPARIDTSRAADELGWSPTVDYRTAMDEIACHHA